MKQALLITSYKDFDQLLALIEGLDEIFNVYVHIDRKSKILPNVYKKIQDSNNVKYIGEDYIVNWGGLNHLKSYLLLSEKALQDKENTMFHLITGQDYPIKGKEYFLEIANSPKCNYIDYFEMPASCWNGGGMDRLEYFNLYDIFDAKKKLKWINRIIRIQQKLKFKRPINDYLGNLYGGNTYWSLSREVLRYVIDFTRTNPKFFNRFKYTFCAEEIYFHTVIMNSPYATEVTNDALRFIDWESGRGGYPAFLDKSDFEALISSNKLFARKIDQSASDLIQMISDYIGAK